MIGPKTKIPPEPSKKPRKSATYKRLLLKRSWYHSAHLMNNNRAVFKLLGISGSLRRASTNTGLLRAASSIITTRCGDAVSFTLADINLPLFNEDIEKQGYPEDVQKLRAQVAEADALLFACPEYNHGVTAPLKNAFDWASRASSAGPAPLTGKPAALVGAGGSVATNFSQKQFRQIAIPLDMHILNRPMLNLNIYANKLFDENGELTDEQTRATLGGIIEALIDFSRRLSNNKK